MDRNEMWTIIAAILMLGAVLITGMIMHVNPHH